MKSIVLSLLLTGASLVSLANGPHKSIGDKTANTAEVKYIAINDGEFLFNVLYNNAGGDRFSVVILDEFGNQLYQSVYSDKKFDKKFKLAEPDSFKKLIFVIRNFADNSVQRFEVKTDSRLVEDVVVKEVK
jgi:hypothetical protein